MDFGAGAYGFGFLAGLLSTLSPCVLPIVPILLGSAAHAHPRAPLALAAGLALSYAVLGTTLAWAGASLGIDASVFRTIGAVVLGLLGVLLVSGTLQQRFALLASGIGSAGNGLMARLPADGLAEDVGVLQQAAQLAQVKPLFRWSLETLRGMAGKTFGVGLPGLFQLLGTRLGTLGKNQRGEQREQQGEQEGPSPRLRLPCSLEKSAHRFPAFTCVAYSPTRRGKTRLRYPIGDRIAAATRYGNFTALMSTLVPFLTPMPRALANDTWWPRVVMLSSCAAKPTL